MDPRVLNLKTPEQCAIFGRNAISYGYPELADEAMIRATQIRAEEYGSESDAEMEALQAVYASEEVLSKRNGKRTTASRTWPLIRRHGIIEALERAVKRDVDPEDYASLKELGLKDFALEAVILRHTDVFSEDAVAKSKERLAEWEAAGD
jgi:hypothetical protein